jgi:hypothetical protein
MTINRPFALALAHAIFVPKLISVAELRQFVVNKKIIAVRLAAL